MPSAPSVSAINPSLGLGGDTVLLPKSPQHGEAATKGLLRCSSHSPRIPHAFPMLSPCFPHAFNTLSPGFPHAFNTHSPTLAVPSFSAFNILPSDFLPPSPRSFFRHPPSSLFHPRPANHPAIPSFPHSHTELELYHNVEHPERFFPTNRALTLWGNRVRALYTLCTRLCTRHAHRMYALCTRLLLACAMALSKPSTLLLPAFRGLCCGRDKG